jgi:hypothetical protein
MALDFTSGRAVRCGDARLRGGERQVHYRVSMTSGGRPAERHAAARALVVEAPSWLSALGHALDTLAVVEGLERLACEVLPNGTVLARDGRSGQGFVVEPLRGPLGLSPIGAPRGAAGATGAAHEDHGGEDASGPLEAMEEDSGAVMPVLPAPGSAAVVGGRGGAVSLQVSESVTVRVPPVAPELPLPEPTAPDAALGLIRRAATVAGACQAALAVAQRFIPCEAGSVLLRQEQGLYVQAASGPRGGALVGTVLPHDRGVVSAVLERGVGLVVREAERDPRFEGHIDRQTGFRTRDLLCAPVRANPAGGPGGPLIGVIQLLNSKSSASFGGMELKGLIQIADVLSIRIQNGPLR